MVREARRRGYAAPSSLYPGMDFDAHELLREGFDAYLRKPLDHRTLAKTILAVVRAR